MSTVVIRQNVRNEKNAVDRYQYGARFVFNCDISQHWSSCIAHCNVKLDFVKLFSLCVFSFCFFANHICCVYFRFFDEFQSGNKTETSNFTTFDPCYGILNNESIFSPQKIT